MVEALLATLSLFFVLWLGTNLLDYVMRSRGTAWFDLADYLTMRYQRKKEKG